MIQAYNEFSAGIKMMYVRFLCNRKNTWDKLGRKSGT